MALRHPKNNRITIRNCWKVNNLPPPQTIQNWPLSKTTTTTIMISCWMVGIRDYKKNSTVNQNWNVKSKIEIKIFESDPISKKSKHQQVSKGERKINISKKIPKIKSKKLMKSKWKRQLNNKTLSKVKKLSPIQHPHLNIRTPKPLDLLVSTILEIPALCKNIF